MKIKKSITWQLGIIIVCVILVSMLVTSISNYWVSYEKTYEAAGIEAVGCANITTGLIPPRDVEEIIKGDVDKRIALEDTINWTTEHKRIFEAQYLLHFDGTILAADSNLQQQGFKAGDAFYIDPEVLQAIQETKHPHYSPIYEFGGMKRITGYAPIFQDHDPTKEIIALNAIDFDANIVSERTWDAVKGSFILGLFPMAIACLITIWLIRRRTKPITSLIDYANKIAGGDLSVEKVSIKNKDEIGDLANTLHVMVHNLRELIDHVRSSAVQVAASSIELTANAEHTNHASKQIAVTMEQMAISVDKQVTSVEDTFRTVQEMSIGVQHIAQNAQGVSSTVLEASERTVTGSLTIKTAVEQMQFISQTVNGLAEMVTGLGNRSKEIGQITEVITGIATQTNLLALNAAIEAARAGEHGRGFAVVADEVRKLAEQSAGSAGQISQLIATIQKETQHAGQTMEVAMKEVNAGMGMVGTAGDSFDQIRTSINEVTTQIQEVSFATQHMAARAEQMVQTMQFISEIAEEAASGTQQISASTEEQLASMEEISSSATTLSHMAEELQVHIGRFRV